MGFTRMNKDLQRFFQTTRHNFLLFLAIRFIRVHPWQMALFLFLSRIDSASVLPIPLIHVHLKKQKNF
jgi:hypothetical protein